MLFMQSDHFSRDRFLLLVVVRLFCGFALKRSPSLFDVRSVTVVVLFVSHHDF